ncbi:MAG: dienelactone hydrolase [Demequinaceae bacterium]|nr:dienelactone hydrolase [Demequinaceae bacterium]
MAQAAPQAHTEDIAEIIFFHHAQGLTDGLRAMAERLRAAGHEVHTPDIYSGAVFGQLDEGLAFASRIGHDAIEEVARRAAREHPHANTTIGFSLGVFPAQLLAQEWRRIDGLVVVAGGLPPRDLGADWRVDVRLSVHVADPDDWIPTGSLEALLRHARAPHIHRYQGLGHMFVDPSSPDYDADAADLFEERLLTWLAEGDLARAHP